MNLTSTDYETIEKLLYFSLNNPIISHILTENKVLTPQMSSRLLSYLEEEKEKQPAPSHPMATGSASPVPSLQNASPKNVETLKKSIRFITENFVYRITLSDVASEAHLNPAYFSSIFKQSTGISFKEYLNLVRVEEAKRLLTTTEFSIIDIAIGIGFEDQSYFSKVFKKYTGLTPKQFRYTSSTSSSTPCP